MGYVPHPPPPLPLLPDGKRQPISSADDSTFEEWVKLPVEDLRTIEEYAANPVPLVRRFPFPPPPPPSTPPRITGELKASFPKGPPNRLIIGGVQPDKPWPRK